MSRLVARVDYEHQQLTFYDPKGFVASGHAAALAVTFLGNLPLVDAKITIPGRAAVDAVCAIDSGADGLHLSTPFTNANHVLEAVAKRISGSSVGAGGESKEFAGRIASLQLGPYVLREPVAAFSPDVKEGLLASSDIGALIGGEILKRFTVTFDFPHQRILLEPNIHFSEPFRANESGLSLLAEGAHFRRFEVDDVEAGSPAELAGLRKGDVVLAMNGQAASELDLDKIDQILQQHGQTIPVTVLRNGRTFKVRMRLRARI
jgi:membrane-associated protease RseP (regulator of RpoE activity)